MYYLIDFENVNTEGFRGIETLTKDDCVKVFYGTKNDRISIDLLPLLMSGNVKIEFTKAVKCVPQNVDFRIGTFVGYLIGKEENGGDIAIISKDKGYQNVREFWEEQGINRVLIAESILDIKKILPKKAVQTFTKNDAETEGNTEETVIPCEESVKETVKTDYKERIRVLFDNEKIPKKNGKTHEAVYKAFENCKSLGDYNFALVDELGRELGMRCYKLTENMKKEHIASKRKGA